MKNCPDGCEDFVESLLNEIETNVKSAWLNLEGIKSISDLHKVEQAFEELGTICDNLY